MTLNTPWLTLFATTVGSGLGLAATHTGLTEMFANTGGGVAMAVGFVLLLVFPTAFVGIAIRSYRSGSVGARGIATAVATGVLGLWFWLVPAQTAFLTGACLSGHYNACGIVAAEGGYAADYVNNQDEYVEYLCKFEGEAEYCRIAAAKQLVSPHTFCPRISIADEFEVVEWCTRAQSAGLLVARR